MRHPTPYPRCIFCDSRANSREHAIPKWISKQLGIKIFLGNMTFENNVGREFKLRRQPISFGSHRARIFCGDCNRHFKHLEDATIPLAVPMATGKPIELRQEAQQTLALWASKTAMALIVATVPEFRDLVPVAHRRVVREEGLPPPDCWVAYFPWAGTPHIAIADQTAADDDMNPPVRYKAYAAILTFAQLGFKVLGFIDPPIHHQISDDRPSVKQFWPYQSEVISWPPWGIAAVDGNMPGLVAMHPLV